MCPRGRVGAEHRPGVDLRHRRDVDHRAAAALAHPRKLVDIPRHLALEAGGVGGSQWALGDADAAREAFEVNYWSPLALVQALVPAEIEDVRAAMYEQARTSPLVATFAARLDATWRTMLGNVLAERVPEADRPLAVAAVLATIQGLLAQRAPRAQRARALAFALERLAGPPGAQTERSPASPKRPRHGGRGHSP